MPSFKFSVDPDVLRVVVRRIADGLAVRVARSIDSEVQVVGVEPYVPKSGRRADAALAARLSYRSAPDVVAVLVDQQDALAAQASGAIRAALLEKDGLVENHFAIALADQRLVVAQRVEDGEVPDAGQ